MDRREIAGCTIPEARGLVKRLPEMLRNEAMMLAAANAGGLK